MTRSRAWTTYLEGRSEAIGLVRLARDLDTSRDPSPPLTANPLSGTLRRSALVILVGHTEAYFNNLSEEVASALTSKWDDLNPGLQRYTAQRAHLELSRLNDQIPSGSLGQPDDRKRYIQRLRAAVDRLEQPGRHPPQTGATPGFYGPQNLAAIARRLEGFRGDGLSFYDWLKREGHDIGQYRTVMDQFVQERGYAAHGELHEAPTPTDTKRYMVLSKSLLRDAERYLAPMISD